MPIKSVVTWKEGMAFDAEAEGNRVRMDSKAPLGKASGPTPKELVAMGLGGCTAMDVIALLKKHKQTVESLTVDVDIETSQGGHPAVFTKALLTFRARGPVEPAILLEAVRKSQTLYCGVTAMLVKAHPVSYVVELNGENIGTGDADFSAAEPRT